LNLCSLRCFGSKTGLASKDGANLFVNRYLWCVMRKCTAFIIEAECVSPKDSWRTEEVCSGAGVHHSHIQCERQSWLPKTRQLHALEIVNVENI